MKRFRRYIFNTLTVVSLLLLLGTAALWVDGIWNKRPLWTEPTPLKGSALRLSTFRHHLDYYDYYGHKGPNANTPTKKVYWTYMGNAYLYEPSYPLVGITLHFWLPSVVFTILPVIWLFVWRKRSKLGPNACNNCGYDLTGNETGECPECGVVGIQYP